MIIGFLMMNLCIIAFTGSSKRFWCMFDIYNSSIYIYIFLIKPKSRTVAAKKKPWRKWFLYISFAMFIYFVVSISFVNFLIFRDIWLLVLVLFYSCLLTFGLSYCFLWLIVLATYNRFMFLSLLQKLEMVLLPKISWQ